MEFVNNYTPPVDDKLGPTILPEEELWGPEPYDINFTFPLLDTLESDRVKLVPFVPRVHANLYWDAVGCDLNIFRFCPSLFPTLSHFLTITEAKVRQDPGNVLFSMIDKTKADPAHPEFGGSFAGVIAILDATPANLKCEIGFVIVFPAFQKTHVSSNAVGILANYCFQSPTDSPPGLGMRRVQWYAHPHNGPSIRLAEKIGMKVEGTIRYTWILSPPLDSEGCDGPEHDPRRGRHSVLLAACWDDWEGGARELVRALIDRKA